MSAATIEQPAVESPTKFVAFDIFNKTIAAGDTIVYATRRGSETFLNKLIVRSVGASGIKGWTPLDPHQRTRTLTNYNTIAKVS